MYCAIIRTFRIILFTASATKSISSMFCYSFQFIIMYLHKWKKKKQSKGVPFPSEFDNNPISRIKLTKSVALYARDHKLEAKTCSICFICFHFVLFRTVNFTINITFNIIQTIKLRPITFYGNCNGCFCFQTLSRF